MTIQELAQRMRERGVGEGVISRVVRLNPRPERGARLRGIHFAPTAKKAAAFEGLVTKGTVIREFGRDAWRCIKPHSIRKDGKRHYIAREAFEDRIWMGRQ